MDYSALQRGDVSVDELAQFAGSSRTSAYKWIRDGREPSGVYYSKVLDLLERIERAVKAGDLPVKLGTPRKQRREELVAALTKHAAS